MPTLLANIVVAPLAMFMACTLHGRKESERESERESEAYEYSFDKHIFFSFQII